MSSFFIFDCSTLHNHFILLWAEIESRCNKLTLCCVVLITESLPWHLGKSCCPFRLLVKLFHDETIDLPGRLAKVFEPIITSHLLSSGSSVEVKSIWPCAVSSQFLSQIPKAIRCFGTTKKGRKEADRTFHLPTHSDQEKNAYQQQTRVCRPPKRFINIQKQNIVILKVGKKK